MKSILGKTLSAFGALALAGNLQAAPIVLSGNHFSVAYDDALVGPYKSGTLSGSLDTVYFQPSAFAVFSAGGSASANASLQLSFTIDPGYVFTGLSFAERGDYFLSSGGLVNATAKLTATNTATQGSVELDLAPAGSLGQVGGSTLWELAGALPGSAVGWPQAFTLTLDSTLFSQPSAGGLGFMQATYVGFTVGTAAAPAGIPEPASIALVVGGLLAMAAAARARRRTAVVTSN